MKLIVALKMIKELATKADDLTAKVKAHCADLDFETPLYPDQRGQIERWIQAHGDIVKEIARLRTAIQKTNILTPVTIELGGQAITKTIAEWIHRRRDLATKQLTIWSSLTDRGLKEGAIPSSTPGSPPREVRIRRYFDPLVRDQKIDLYRSEPGIIDRNLEVTNATVDLIES